MIITCLRVSGDEDVVRPLRGLVGDSDSLRLGFLFSVDDGLLNYELHQIYLVQKDYFQITFGLDLMCNKI